MPEHIDTPGHNLMPADYAGSSRDGCATAGSVAQAFPPADYAGSSRDGCATAGSVAQPSSPVDTATPPSASALLEGQHQRGYLPHLKAKGATYFVTFRLADTLPREVLDGYRFERAEILRRAEAAGRELTPADQRRLADLYSQQVESYLDAGHGQCWLKHKAIGRMVANALRHFDGERYDLHAWVVMPNHVHVVVTPREGATLSSILHSWKSFTAHEVQKVA